MAQLRCRGYLQRDDEGLPSLFAGIITNIGKKGRIDPICHLPNKFDFENQLSGSRSYNGIMILGLDEFKVINSLYGHDFGDEVLKATAARLQELIPKGFSLYRLEGDHFGLLSLEPNESVWRHLYTSIRKAFQNQKNLYGQKYYCTVSAGCALEQEPCANVELYKQAEFAMEAAKKRGRNQLCMFEPALMEKRLRQLAISQHIREDVEQDCKNFWVVYQPQIENDDGRICGAEALLRWHSETLGNVTPDEFIPVLEGSGMIHEVGRWVLLKAAATCKRWREKIPDFVMSINVSYLQFLRKNFTADLAGILDEVGLEPEALALELTESYLVSDNRMLSEAFTNIRQMGMKIAMDDFGTGYSSLAVLKNSPTDLVKIDRAFVKDILNSRFEITFIQFAIALCHSVDIKVCLEGVETNEEYLAIKEMGLDMIQGYLFGRPVTEEEFAEKYLT